MREKAEKKKALEEENRLKRNFENRHRSARKLKDNAGPIASNWIMNIFAVIQVLAIIYYLTR